MTHDLPTILVATPDQKHIIHEISQHLPVAGIFNPSRRRMPDGDIPVGDDFAELIEQGHPVLCGFLTPYRALPQHVRLCIERHIHFACAGPIPDARRSNRSMWEEIENTHLHARIGRCYAHSRLFRTLRAESGVPEFGSPVFLRHTRGGGHGTLSSWWAACHALDQATALIASTTAQCHVTATRIDRHCQITLTLLYHSGAHAQLVIAPGCGAELDDIMLLGTGGLIAYDSLSNNAGVLKSGVVHPIPSTDPPLEAVWLRDFAGQVVENKSNPYPLTLHVIGYRIRQAVQESARMGIPVRIAEG